MKKSKQDGYTFVEALISVAILAGIINVSTQTLAAIARSSTSVNSQTRALNEAQNIASSLRSGVALTDIIESYSNWKFHKQILIRNNSSSGPNLVKVSFTNRSLPKFHVEVIAQRLD